ncbi:MAG: molybdopterin-dependent oxidoreductase [Anaerolineaceae bacterium]|nr:molybdopterin-dependent oxidoreductase [Anaerolineaceae bacterium]
MSDNLIPIELTVNGKPVKAEVTAKQSLLRFLRDDLGLMGTKDGCSDGHCGACSVIIDGKLTRSCLVKVNRLDGANIITIEGLAISGELDPIQQAFIDAGAIQCGFCTAGMIMSAKALLDANPEPSVNDIKKALAQNRNLCRCTGYVNIIKAIQLAAERRAGKSKHQGPPAGAMPQHAMLDDVAEEIVTGKKQYADDLLMEDMLYGKVLWSAHPHAEILSIDTSEAEALPGVRAVITAKDIPGKNQSGIVIRDQPAIAEKKVRYIGDSVASVFADRPEIAAEALGRIKVEYKVLPGVFSPLDAAKPDAPKVHEKGNLLHRVSIVRGDVEEAFKKCKVVIEGDYTTPFIEHGFLEPESGLAYTTDDGGVVIKYPTQCAFDDRTQLSEILDLPEEKIRVIAIMPGGAFGGKEDLIFHQHLALGAIKTGKPVKITLSREESLRVHVKRHPAWMHYKTGVDSEGHLLAMESRVVLDTGAYCSLGLDVLENTAVFAAGPYFVPNFKILGESWYTNNVLAGAMRGFGVNQVAVGLEQQMDAMAIALKMDPLDFRMINALDDGMVTVADHVLEPGVAGIKQTTQAVKNEQIKKPATSSNGKKIGLGFASAVKNAGFGHNLPEKSGTRVDLDVDGHFTIHHSQHEYGQGAQSALVTLAARELGVSPERISVYGPDTALTPPTGPTTASRQTFMTGNALLLTCQALKAELFNRVADQIGVNPSNLQFDLSRIVDRETGNGIELRALGEHFHMEKEYVPPATAQIFEKSHVSKWGSPDFVSQPTHWCYSYTTQAALVEVDPDTGEVNVLKVVAAVDVGKIINRAAIEAQIHGGVMMGVGSALSEHYIIENGVNTTDSLYKVRLPTAEMTPEVVPLIVEVPHPQGPQGAKGFAEAPSMATAPAILNAIYDAIGVRIYDIPADKKRIKDVISKKA